MFIGHLPAGYVLTKTIQNRFHTQRFLWAGLVASVLPDIDIFYFYFVDNKQSLHHAYWIHIPLYWLLICLAVFTVIWICKKSGYYVMAFVFF